MREPYLLLGVRMAASAPERLAVLATILAQLEQLLAGHPLTELKAPDVYVVELPQSKAFVMWRQVSQLLMGWDSQLGDDLHWFVQLADREGNELSFN